jgi:hypothetical protein
MVTRSNEEGLEHEQAKTAEENHGANQSEESTPGLVRIPPPGRADPNGLDERRILVWHFLLLLMGGVTEDWGLV